MRSLITHPPPLHPSPPPIAPIRCRGSRDISGSHEAQPAIRLNHRSIPTSTYHSTVDLLTTRTSSTVLDLFLFVFTYRAPFLLLPTYYSYYLLLSYYYYYYLLLLLLLLLYLHASLPTELVPGSFELSCV
jgi:hypothetical protein